MRPSGPRYYTRAALAGYLYNGIAISDTIHAICAGATGGTAGPLKRYLHEALLDVLFLVSDSDPDLLAAKTILGELKDSLRLVGEYREVLAGNPAAGLPPVPDGWTHFDRPIEDILRDLNAQNIAHGGTDDLFTRAWASWTDLRYWHWSGLPRGKLIETLVGRGKLDGPAAFRAMSLTKVFNSFAHPAPAWSDLPPLADHESFEVPSRLADADVDQLAAAARIGIDMFVAGHDGSSTRGG